VLPLINETYAIVANTAMFKEAGLVDAAGLPLAPKTWEEFYQFAKKLHKTSGGAVVQQGASLQWSAINTYATLLAVLRGALGNVYKADGVTLNFDNPEFREILKVWKKGVDEGVFSKEMYADHMAGRNSLMAGKIAMLLDAGGRFIEGEQTLGEENVYVIPFPGADTRGSFGFGAGVIIPKSTPVADLAVQFIKEQLMSEMVQTSTVNKWGKMPAMLKFYDLAEAPEWKVLKDIANKSGAIPTYSDFARFQKEAPPILQNYLDGRIDLEKAISEFDRLAVSLDKSLF
jgi:ABC-type glycerol-3-phosphate transport system substrate-binding protein